MMRSFSRRYGKVVLPVLLIAAVAVEVQTVYRCPYGHTELRWTRILYGLLMWTDELEQAVLEGKVVPGGCLVSPNSPHSTPICRICGFKKVPPTGSSWHRDSSDLASFKIPLPWFFEKIHERFARGIERSGRAPHYAQSIKDGVVTAESGAFEVIASEEATVATLRRLIAENPWLARGAREVALKQGDPRVLWIQFEVGDHQGGILVLGHTEEHQEVTMAWNLSPSAPSYPFTRSRPSPPPAL